MAKDAPKTIWLAEFETRHFSFKAIGFTEEAAIHACVEGWKHYERGFLEDHGHRLETQISRDDVNTLEMEPGGLYRDFDCIVTADVIGKPGDQSPRKMKP